MLNIFNYTRPEATQLIGGFENLWAYSVPWRKIIITINGRCFGKTSQR